MIICKKWIKWKHELNSLNQYIQKLKWDNYAQSCQADYDFLLKRQPIKYNIFGKSC